jgi:hypothetical protein
MVDPMGLIAEGAAAGIAPLPRAAERIRPDSTQWLWEAAGTAAKLRIREQENPRISAGGKPGDDQPVIEFGGILEAAGK